jgi:glycosyltransferase involved in cell wall biosynthesis
VIPIYDEELAIAQVVREWIPVLRATGATVVVRIIDDGSRDGTPAVLADLSREFPELSVHRQPNAGHGPACLRGYRDALADGADWIFQIDSDGQCDPQYFPQLWALREQHRAVYGVRTRRDDGLQRWMISRVVSTVVFATMGRWVRDANVPYRLMHRDVLADAVRFVSDDVPLLNIVIAALQIGDVAWVPIRFLRRIAGQPKLSIVAMAGHAPRLIRALREVRRARESR